MSLVRADLNASLDLLEIVSSLLRISRIESGSYGGSIEALDINSIIYDAVELYQATAENKFVTIVVELDEKMALNGDKNLLFQMVANLLDNAIKYSPEHSAIALHGETIGKKISLSVADKGPGVTDSDHDKMVEKFTRLDPSRSYPGSGLGLSLVTLSKAINASSLFLKNSISFVNCLCIPLTITSTSRSVKLAEFL